MFSQSYKGWKWICWVWQWLQKALSIMCLSNWQHILGVMCKFFVFAMTLLPITDCSSHGTCSPWISLDEQFLYSHGGYQLSHVTSQFCFYLLKQSAVLVARRIQLFFFFTLSSIQKHSLLYFSLYVSNLTLLGKLLPPAELYRAWQKVIYHVTEVCGTV